MDDVRSSKPRVLAALPGGIHHLVKQAGVTEAVVRRHLNSLHGEGRAFILRWSRTGGGPTPYWVAGTGQHAKKPRARTNAEWCQRHRKRVVKAIEKAAQTGVIDPRYVKHIRRKQADATVQQARKQPQNPFSALGL